jgi:calcineurin-like phosphoesterase family protein
MKDVWFTSDWHLGHANIIKFCKRPFSNTHEMNESIIENHNALVKPGDTVYHHGDMFFKIGYEDISYLMARFNGLFHIIIGNHDKLSVLQRLKEDGLIESIQDTRGEMVNGTYFWMSHYPHRSWNRAYHGALHTYGHVHSLSNECTWRNSIDVGIDGWDYKPAHFDDVVEVIKTGTEKLELSRPISSRQKT